VKKNKLCEITKIALPHGGCALGCTWKCVYVSFSLLNTDSCITMSFIINVNVIFFFFSMTKNRHHRIHNQ